MMEPLPLARSEASPEARASWPATNLLSALLVVMPMSKLGAVPRIPLLRAGRRREKVVDVGLLDEREH
jgi:hypothetical protein